MNLHRFWLTSSLVHKQTFEANFLLLVCCMHSANLDAPESGAPRQAPGPEQLTLQRKPAQNVDGYRGCARYRHNLSFQPPSAGHLASNGRCHETNRNRVERDQLLDEGRPPCAARLGASPNRPSAAYDHG